MSSNAVGCLQEFCMKNHLNLPIYLVTNESGSPHAKTFTVTCQVGNHVTTGSGHTKKEAKKIAATSLLSLVRSGALESSKQLGGKSANSPKELNGKEMENIDISAAPGSSPSALQPNPGAENMDHDGANESLSLVGVNTVGRLQEMAQAKKWKMPLYQERGTINSLQCVKCTLEDITTEGWSTTKKEAKKIAASKMLAQLNVSRSFGSTSPFGSPITSTTTSASEITNPTIFDAFNSNSIPVSDNLIDIGITTDNEVSLNIKTEEMVNTQVTSQE